MNNDGIEPTQRFSDPTELQEEIARSKELLENLFGDPGLQDLRAEQPDHPAVRDYDRLGEIETGSLPFAEESDYVRSLWTLMLDRSTWAREGFDASDLALLGGAEAIRQVRSRIAVPEQYPDVMAELFFLGWLRTCDIEAQLREEEGRPDIEASFNRSPFWLEVKRVSHESVPGRIRKVIGKANKQIKRATPDEAGVAFIHLAREGSRVAMDDRIPSDVEPYVNEARREMGSDHSRSVGLVVISWDDMFVLGAPSDGATLYALRRRSLVIDHRHARTDVRRTVGDLNVGMTVTTWIRYGDPEGTPRLEPIQHGNDLVLTPGFRDLNEFHSGIRPGHVLEIINDPDATATFEVDEVEVQLATRVVNLGRSPYVTLIESVRRPGEPLEVVAGYKILGHEEEVVALGADPWRTFVVMLRRFGLPIRVGSQTGKFIPYERLTLPEGEDVSLVEGLHEGSFQVSALMHVEEGQPRTARVTWAYAVDTDAYRQSLRSG